MASQKKASGSLVIGGSGLKSISQFTLEAIMHIEKADKVFYLVSDVTAEGFIRDKNSNAVDLYQYYSNSQERVVTYIQMTEVRMLIPYYFVFSPRLAFRRPALTRLLRLGHAGTRERRSTCCWDLLWPSRLLCRPGTSSHCNRPR